MPPRTKGTPRETQPWLTQRSICGGWSTPDMTTSGRKRSTSSPTCSAEVTSELIASTLIVGSNARTHSAAESTLTSPMSDQR